jgi:hypothetical protein
MIRNGSEFLDPDYADRTLPAGLRVREEPEDDDEDEGDKKHWDDDEEDDDDEADDGDSDGYSE